MNKRWEFHWGHKYRDAVLQVRGSDAGLRTMLCKKITAARSKEVQTGCNLAEFSGECHGPKRADDNDEDDDDEKEK
jgi:hypothetical protein